MLNAVEETHTDCPAVGIAGVYTQLQKARRARKEGSRAAQHGAGAKWGPCTRATRTLQGKTRSSGDLRTYTNQQLLRAYSVPSKLLSTFPTESPSSSYSAGEMSESERVKRPPQVYTASNGQSSALEQSPESACSAGVARDLSLIPASQRPPGGGNGNPLSVFSPGQSHGQRSLVGCSPRGPRGPASLPHPGLLCCSAHTTGTPSVPSHVTCVAFLFILQQTAQCRARPRSHRLPT